jgi:predicted ester cyclase
MEEIVRSYFREAIDGGRAELIRELFTSGCVIHRPELEIRGVAPFTKYIGSLLGRFSSFKTTIHDVFSGQDRVAVRLQHDAVSTSGFHSRIGTFDVAGRAVSWNAMAIFRFEGTSIAEEWVNRDELGMLLN